MVDKRSGWGRMYRSHTRDTKAGQQWAEEAMKTDHPFEESPPEKYCNLHHFNHQCAREDCEEKKEDHADQ